MSESEQLDLNLKTHLADSATEAQQLNTLLNWLKGRDWTTAREIQHALGLNDRRIRRLAETSSFRIASAPGTKGYKLTDDLTPSEFRMVDSKWRSQTRKNIARRIGISRRWHSAPTRQA